MATVTKLNLKAEAVESGDRHGRDSENEAEQNVAVAATSDSKTKRVVVELGNGSQVIYMPKFLAYDQSWDYLEYLNKNIPWKRPTIRVFGRSCVQVLHFCNLSFNLSSSISTKNFFFKIISRGSKSLYIY